MSTDIDRKLISLARDAELPRLLDLAVKEERYEHATIIRDEIKDRGMDRPYSAWWCRTGGHIVKTEDRDKAPCYNGRARTFDTAKEAQQYLDEMHDLHGGGCSCSQRRRP